MQLYSVESHCMDCYGMFILMNASHVRSYVLRSPWQEHLRAAEDEPDRQADWPADRQADRQTLVMYRKFYIAPLQDNECSLPALKMLNVITNEYAYIITSVSKTTHSMLDECVKWWGKCFLKVIWVAYMYKYLIAKVVKIQLQLLGLLFYMSITLSHGLSIFLLITNVSFAEFRTPSYFPSIGR